jgi:site-specific DNA-methyltransferase (adenine-specific)
LKLGSLFDGSGGFPLAGVINGVEHVWASEVEPYPVAATPQDFFDKLNSEFHFTLDPCANKHNHKCDKYYTAEDDGLTKDWGGQIVFCNPPYGSAIKDWVKKCSEESKKDNTTVVMLIPARTDTKYFHDYIYQKENVEVRFLRGRLKFGNSENSAPFPSMVVVFR